MKKLLLGLGIFLIAVACGEEDPKPNAFVHYDLPFNQNMSADLLEDLDRQIEVGTYGDIHSLLILRNDRIVFEKYYANWMRSDLHPIGASTQSIVSILTGIALEENEQVDARTKIVDLLPAYQEYFADIPQKDQIEIRHLLSNSSGLWWDEWSHPFGSEENDAYRMTLSDDWVSTVLSTPMIREPGFDFNFNSGNGILMAPVLQNVVGEGFGNICGRRNYLIPST